MHRGVYYINALPLSPFQFLVFFLLEPWHSERKKGAAIA